MPSAELKYKILGRTTQVSFESEINEFLVRLKKGKCEQKVGKWGRASLEGMPTKVYESGQFFYALRCPNGEYFFGAAMKVHYISFS